MSPGLSPVLLLCACVTVRMPGRSFEGDPPPLTEEEEAWREELHAHVEALAVGIGPRAVALPGTMERAEAWLNDRFVEAGYPLVERLRYTAGSMSVANLVVQRVGTVHPEEVVVIGAHYDTVPTSPGADDNTSAVAALLVLARLFHDVPTERTLRFVAFANEEPPWFWEDEMGSLVYARSLRERDEQVVAMLSLECLGYFRDDRRSQRLPPPLGLVYPDTGDFISFISNRRSKRLLAEVGESFRTVATVPSEGGAIPIFTSGWSDHWSFWQVGYPALMVTDTALFRNPHYHEPTDLPETLDWDRLTRVVTGLRHVVGDLAGAGVGPSSAP